MVEIGKRLRNLRESKRMTQKEIAEKLNVTPQTISKWERDKSQPDLQTLLELSAFFDVSIDELLGNKRAKEPKPNFWKGRDKMTKEKQNVKEDSISCEDKPVIAIVDITANFLNQAGQPYTQMLGARLEKWLKRNQQELRVETYCSNLLDQVGNSAKIILLAPNFSYAIKEVQKKFPYTPVLTISDKEYGLLNVAKIGSRIEQTLM